jgi:hypothetical protein
MISCSVDWWTSWEFQELNEELTKLANQMNLEQIRKDIMRKARITTKFGLDLKSKGMFQILCNQFL